MILKQSKVILALKDPAVPGAFVQFFLVLRELGWTKKNPKYSINLTYVDNGQRMYALKEHFSESEKEKALEVFQARCAMWDTAEGPITIQD